MKECRNGLFAFESGRAALHRFVLDFTSAASVSSFQGHFAIAKRLKGRHLIAKAVDPDLTEVSVLDLSRRADGEVPVSQSHPASNYGCNERHSCRDQRD